MNPTIEFVKAYLTEDPTVNAIIVALQLLVSIVYFVFIYSKSREVKANALLNAVYLFVFLSVLYAAATTLLYLALGHFIGIVGIMGIAVMIIKMNILNLTQLS